MALTERERLYEVLIRFQPDGTYAAHQRRISEILDGDDVKAATEGPALPLAPEDVQHVLGEAFVAVEAHRTEAVAQCSEHEATISTLASQLEAALDREATNSEAVLQSQAAHTAEVETLNRELQDRGALLEAAADVVKRKDMEIEDLKLERDKAKDALAAHLATANPLPPTI